ncbi:STM3941 family protein [Sphingobacterium sp. UDSM-2020]|uniref:STM3941 family protein n=1 Tax=Sphingobacterium sp. UDSM-2020 TaxID=2795738 RepID=UPI001934E66D|nr:STM3941 family protein [Sphingobacterium sp. UDSM-2020]QQD11621.1 hypothetical protein JAZ75_13365 [Sphingobacterium sp. UDSM-2020]
MKEIVVTFNKKRKCALFAIFISFILLGLFMLIYSDVLTQYWVISSPWTIRFVGLMCLLCFGMMFLLSFRVLFFRKIALIINDHGFVDNSSAGGEAGEVKWSEVTNVVNAGNSILIFLKDPDSFVHEKKSFINKRSLKMNLSNYGTPVVIQMFALNSYIDTLERQIKDRWEYYKLITGENMDNV